MKKQIKIIFTLAFGLGLSACSKTEIVEPAVVSHSNTSGSFELLQKKVLTKSCATSGCHSSTTDASYKQHKLVLTGAELYSNLINGAVANSKAQAAGLKQIVPKDPASSFFYQKVNFANSPHQYGNSMPLGSDMLTEKQIKFIYDWIVAGAPEKGHVADEELLLH
jgi:hypothetical protein